VSFLHPFRDHRRNELRGTPLSPEQRAIVEKNAPFAARLSEDDRRELEGHMQVFLDEKRFEGCGGLELTDEMRVTIAAHACRLLLHRETDYYPELESILVYPHAYVVPARRTDGRIVIEGDEVRLGESWVRGTVILAWDHVKGRAAHLHDGHNVVLHELAHQLDAEDGAMDGTPELGAQSLYGAWSNVLGREFLDLEERLAQHLPTDIDPYGATSPAEFFAVVTETFFEAPDRLRAKHPELYEVLAEFYRQRP
jgi:hypothetical protein